jgi:transposase
MIAAAAGRRLRVHESLEPRKGGGRPPKAEETIQRLLEEDVHERPAATIADRSRFLQSMTGKSLSVSTLKRLLTRMSFSQKNGLWGRWNGMSGEERPGR